MKVKTKENKKNKYGQYFTDPIVADFMIGLADINENSEILEPSCGEGVFLELFLKKDYKNLTAYEIDNTLAHNYNFVKYESFISAKIDKKFDLVIGNPPYIRWKNLENELKTELLNNEIWNKYFNALCDYLYIFILKSIELLKDDGQLIFICPEYWMNTTHSISLRNYMVQNGYFEEIYHFNETPIFEQVTVSIVIFKFIKSKKKNKEINVTKYYSKQKLTKEILQKIRQREHLSDIEYLKVIQFKINERWILQTNDIINELNKFETYCKKKVQSCNLNLFENDKQEYHTLGEFCDIGNGLVSGLDKAFQLNGHQLTENEKNATINVVKAKNLKPYFVDGLTKYIFISENLDEENFKSKYPNFYDHLKDYTNLLDDRYKYNRDINYWEWAFLRNLSLFNRKEKRIFVPSKDRISNKNYFRFALVNENIYPTQDVTAIFKKSSTKESIEYIVSFLNTEIVFKWLNCYGIVKGNIIEFSEKPISSIPFKAINWNDEFEVDLHNKITILTKTYLLNHDKEMLSQINKLFKQLFRI